MGDAVLQVAPDGAGKKIDMEFVSTQADGTVYRQRAAIVGDAADALFAIQELLQQQLSVSRAILAMLNAESTSGASEEKFSN